MFNEIKHSGATVIGYPGERDSELHGMSGDYNLENKNRVITCTQIDTSPGQSGSPKLRGHLLKIRELITFLNTRIIWYSGVIKKLLPMGKYKRDYE